MSCIRYKRLTRLGGVSERNGQRDHVLRTDVAQDVSLPGCIFGEQDAARPEPEFLASLELDLALARQRHDVLAARRRMPVVEIFMSRPPELQARGRECLRQLGA